MTIALGNAWPIQIAGWTFDKKENKIDDHKKNKNIGYMTTRKW